VNKVLNSVLKGLLVTLGVLVALAAGLGGYYAYRLSLRPERSDEAKALFEGITYERHIKALPRPLVVHVVTVDLTAPGVDFLVTPSVLTDGYPLASDTVPGFLSRYSAQVAINGSFFTPHYVKSPFNYYPHVGDGVGSLGVAISKGDRYNEAKGGWAALCIISNQDIQITKNDCPPETRQGIAGDIQIVKGGQLYDGLAVLKHNTALYPRSAIAINADNTKLLIVAIDGRQRGYSEGVTIAELGEIMIELGADRALNFDGGGSTTLAVSDPENQPVVLNAPFQARIPMNLRPVANHLGVFANPLPAERLSRGDDTE